MTSSKCLPNSYQARARAPALRCESTSHNNNVIKGERNDKIGTRLLRGTIAAAIRTQVDLWEQAALIAEACNREVDLILNWLGCVAASELSEADLYELLKLIIEAGDANKSYAGIEQRLQ